MGRHSFAISRLAIILCLSPATVLADKLPKDTAAVDPKLIIQHFNGKASEWNGGGIAYWGKGGEYQGLSKDGSWYGIGKWYVTAKGTLCHESTWYPVDRSEKPSVEKPYCWKHAIDPSGQIWEESGDEAGNWYEFTGKKEVSGSKYAGKLKKIRKSLGL